MRSKRKDEANMSDFSFAANKESKFVDKALRCCCCAEMLRSRALISFWTRKISASILDDAPGISVCRLIPTALLLNFARCCKSEFLNRKA